MPESPVIIPAIATIIVALIGLAGVYLARRATKSNPVPATASEPPPFSTRPRILIVDDNAPFTEAARATLNGDYEIVACTNVFLAGHELIDARRYGKPFAAALVDLNMPGISGSEMAQAVRLFQPQTKLVIMSGGEIDHASFKLADECWYPKSDIRARMRKLLGSGS